MYMYATRSTEIEIRIPLCCGTGCCWGLAAGAVKVALQGRGSLSRRSGPEAALGVVVFDDPRLGMPTSEGAGSGWLSMTVLCLRSAGVFAEVREDVEELERGCCVYSMGGL